ncbi:PP2C family protein-serine/threonine phosphatase [Holophaga foetida]|uniref:PP2C family protein-serine/threonine phosphatase n=1 Tax=Holophaga foetida TaxID=35839 RepID=UPI0002475084|nr:protein phosphatase 2C domain-containing protein [Holophaga foetida]
MLIDYAAITHQGRVRKNNEDGYLVSALDGEEPNISFVSRSPQVCRAGLLAAVADGMGGAAAGEIASREGLASMAVTMFGHWGRFPMESSREEDLLKALLTSAEVASHSVLRYSDSDRSSRGMGSTLTAAVIWNGFAYIVHVGDSRAYIYRRPHLHQLTTDHTLVNEMVLAGSITPEQAKVHPQRSMITQALGCPRPLDAALVKVPVKRGDRLLLCSDGLHGEVEDDGLKSILDFGFSPRRSVELMVELALDRGGRDNVTALLLALDDPAFPLPAPGEAVQWTEPALQSNPPARSGISQWFKRFVAGRP